MEYKWKIVFVLGVAALFSLQVKGNHFSITVHHPDNFTDPNFNFSCGKSSKFASNTKGNNGNCSNNMFQFESSGIELKQSELVTFPEEFYKFPGFLWYPTSLYDYATPNSAEPGSTTFTVSLSMEKYINWTVSVAIEYYCLSLCCLIESHNGDNRINLEMSSNSEPSYHYYNNISDGTDIDFVFQTTSTDPMIQNCYGVFNTLKIQVDDNRNLTTTTEATTTETNSTITTITTGNETVETTSFTTDTTNMTTTTTTESNGISTMIMTRGNWIWFFAFVVPQFIVASITKSL